MGILGAVSGILGGGIIKSVGKIADNLITTDEERSAGELSLYKAETDRQRVDSDLLKEQLKVNRQEAGHSSIYVAGWRPAVGWFCGFGIAYHFILRPMIEWIVAIVTPIIVVHYGLNPESFSIITPPALNIGQLLALIMPMLGISGARSWEKYKGVARKAIKE